MASRFEIPLVHDGFDGWVISDPAKGKTSLKVCFWPVLGWNHVLAQRGNLPRRVALNGAGSGDG